MTADKHPLSGFLRDLMAHERLSEGDRNAILELPFRVRKLDPGSYLVARDRFRHNAECW